MMRAVSLITHFMLWLVDVCSAREHRARRRERVYVFIHHLIASRYVVEDVLLPSRRQAIARRRTAIAELGAFHDRAREEDCTRAAGTFAPGTASGDSDDVSGSRIAVFIPSFLRGQGGAEKVAGQVAGALVDSGARVALFCRAPTGAPPAYGLDQRVEVCLLDERDDPAIRAYRSRDFDLVIGFGMAHFYRRIAHIATLLDAPFVIQECTNPNAMMRLLRRLSDAHSDAEAMWLRQAVLAQARAVRLTSSGYAESADARIRKNVYAFFNSFSITAERALCGDPDKVRKIICVGALKNANKNGAVVAREFGQFSRGNEGWSLRYYGTNNYREEFEAACAANPSADIRDEGVETDITRIYADAYVLIIPSFEEGLPNVVVEAFSFGVPCIGFEDCEGVRQLVRDGENGFLVERDDVDALESALRRISDPDCREHLSRGAYEFAKRNFGFEQWRTNWLRLVHHAVHGLDRSGRKTSDDRKLRQTWNRLLETYRVVC